MCALETCPAQADPGGQRGGQHRQRPPRQIAAETALFRLLVELRDFGAMNAATSEICTPTITSVRFSPGMIDSASSKSFASIGSSVTVSCFVQSSRSTTRHDLQRLLAIGLGIARAQVEFRHHRVEVGGDFAGLAHRVGDRPLPVAALAAEQPDFDPVAGLRRGGNR